MTNLPYDMPDNYPWLPGSGKSTLTDIGDLAVRLGSIVSYDRRGTVLTLDDFSCGLGMVTGNNLINGASINLSVDYALSKGFSCKLVTQNIAQATSSISKSFRPGNETALGVEGSFSPSSNLYEFWISITYLRNSITLNAALKFNVQNGTLYYRKADLSFESLISFSSYLPVEGRFHTMKVVIDVENKNYIRVLFDNREFDISDKALSSGVSGNYDLATVSFVGSPNVNSNHNLWIDNLIVTTGDI